MEWNMINRKLWLLIFCSLILWINITKAQIYKNRHYEPIVITGDSLFAFSDTLLNYEIEHLYLYAYHAEIDSFIMIPFQIEEVDTSLADEDKYFKPEKDSLLRGVFDFDDELVFMAADLGDKADLSQWLGDTLTVRYELEFTDSLDYESGYVYLYYEPDKTYPVPAYDMTFEDGLVSSANYEISFNNTGQLSNVTILGGTGQEIFDRLKVRAIGSWSFIPLFIWDDNFEEQNNTYAKENYANVRIILNTDLKFTHNILGSNDIITQTTFFYPGSGNHPVLF